MRLVTDLIKEWKLTRLLIYSSSIASSPGSLKDSLLSAIANWQQKNEGTRVEDSKLYVSKISVDGGQNVEKTSDSTSGKSIQDQKRSNHVTLFLESTNKDIENTSK